ncbi:MAG: pentapeptide repeat-containing protein [Proteobacteria bacterium]|nr:pentapeptide repeat-containing protein [Pseudomonadota bacterium]
MTKKTQSGLWYVKRGDEVKGPFRWESIDAYVALGRIRDNDRLSEDRSRWRRVKAFRDRLNSARCDGERAALPVFDERRGDRRAPGPGLAHAAEEQRVGSERRSHESAEVLERRARSERVWAGLKTHSQGTRGPMIATAALLITVLILAVALSIPTEQSSADCLVPAAAQVNWDFCNKPGVRIGDRSLVKLSARNAKLVGAVIAGSDLTGANLAYADLTGADLSLSNLSGARMVGANLSHAKLGHARMVGTDLRFADLSGALIAGADLTGAQLANAIWVDGRTCRRDSIGACIVR